MLFHNTQKIETRRGTALQVLFVARTTTLNKLTEAALLLVTGFASFTSLIIVKYHVAT